MTILYCDNGYHYLQYNIVTWKVDAESVSTFKMVARTRGTAAINVR